MDDFKTAGGLGRGGAAPPFAKNMIRATFPYFKHADDMLFRIGSMDGFETGGVRERSLRPNLQTQ